MEETIRNCKENGIEEMTIISTKTQSFRDVSEWLTRITDDKNAYVYSGWELIDDLKDGIEQFGGKERVAVHELYELASAQLSWTIKTLQNYVSIARSFPPERRVYDLGISHYKAVLGLPDGEQDELLDKAFAGGMTEESLRHEVRKTRPNFVPLERNESAYNDHYEISDTNETVSCDDDFDKNLGQAERTYTIIDEYGTEETVRVKAGEELSVVSVDPPGATPYNDPAIAKPHVAQNSGNNEWYTPAEYIEAARSVMGDIDLDPASCELANEIVRAKEYYTADDNGLNYLWHGRVWMNPPYAKGKIDEFAKKMHDHCLAKDISEAIVLVNNATETEWFQNLITVASAVVFPRSRVRFYRSDGKLGDPLQGQAIIYIGTQVQLFRDVFEFFGWSAKL